MSGRGERCECVCVLESSSKRTTTGCVIFVCACVFHHPVWLFSDWLVCVCVCYIPVGRGGGPLRGDYGYPLIEAVRGHPAAGHFSRVTPSPLVVPRADGTSEERGGRTGGETPGEQDPWTAPDPRPQP